MFLFFGTLYGQYVRINKESSFYNILTIGAKKTYFPKFAVSTWFDYQK